MKDRARWLAEKAEETHGLFDRVFSIDYDLRFPTTSQTHRTFVKYVTDNVSPDAWILDAGCGTGKYWQALLDRGLGVVGVDFSKELMQRAHEKFPAIRTTHTSIQELTRGPEFQAVLCIDVLDLVPADDWEICLANLQRALLPGGMFYMTVEVVEESELAMSQATARQMGLPVIDREVAHGGYYHYHPTTEQVIAALAKAGLTATHTGLGGGYTHYLAKKG